MGTGGTVKIIDAILTLTSEMFTISAYPDGMMGLWINGLGDGIGDAI